mgnify:FL=1
MFIRRYFQIIVIFLVITGIFLWAWTTNGSEGIVASDIVITEIAANVANENDDEYFIIRNITCQDINLEGISVRDAALKTYNLTGILPSHASRTIGYAESRIQLNNTSETLTIWSSAGLTIDEKQYTKTTKWVPLLYTSSDQDCSIVIPSTGSTTWTAATTSDSWSSSSWEISTWSGWVGEAASSGVTSSGGATSSWDTSWTSSSGVVDITSSWSDASYSWTFTSSGSGDISGSGVILSGSVSNVISSGIETWSGTNSSTGVISENTSPGSSASSLDTSSSTGITQDTVTTFTGELAPIFLSIEDADANNTYDTVKIAYNEDLTGSIDLSALLVFSATWWLFSDHKFEGTWAFASWEISGNILTLYLLREVHIDSSSDIAWKVNSTTSSHFRIKGSTKNLQGLSSHRVARDLTYTTILGGYSRDMISVQPLTPSAITTNATSSSQTSAGGASVSENTSTWFVVSSTDSLSGSTQTPVFSLHLQYPSNATLSGDTIVCTQLTCRTNFEILIASWSLKSCTFTLNGVVIAESCNPPSLTLDQIMSYVIDISATAKTGEIYSRHLLWSYVPQITSSSTKSASSSSQSSCFVSGERELLQIVWVNPSPKDAKRSSEYVLVKNSTNTPVSLCGCHLERTDDKWKITLSKDLEATIMPWVSYQLTTSESKLTLPKVGAKIDLVCDAKVIDTIHYQGNHVDDRLITREMIETEDQMRRFLHEYFLTWSIDTTLDISEDASWSVDLGLLSNQEWWDEEDNFLDLTPVLLWSLSASTITSDLSERDDGSIECYTTKSWCTMTAEIVGLGSHMKVRWMIDGVDTEDESGSIWTKKQNHSFELLPGAHSIQVAFMSDDGQELFEPIISSVQVVSESIVSRKLSTPLKPKKAKKVTDPKTKKSLWKQSTSPKDAEVRIILSSSQQAAWTGVLLSVGTLGWYYVRRRILTMFL